MPKICVVGSLNMDLCVEAPRVPAMGETVIGGGFFTSPGGKGANQAVAAARLGAEVTMLGCVGDDAFGRQLLDNLRTDGVDTSHIQVTKNAPTGVAVILLHGGDNCIVVDPGANMRFLPEDLDEGAVAASDMLVLQLEIPLATARRAMELAKLHGVPVLLDPAPAQRVPADFLALADVVKPNESECKTLTGMDDPRRAAQALAEIVPRVVVTLGGKGVLLYDGDQTYSRPAWPVAAIDATGAGDCFTGALAVSLAGGMDFGGAADFAQAAAALAVTRRGAQASMPTLEEVTAFISIEKTIRHG